MRHLVLSVSLCLAACGSPPPCDLPACAASCPDVAAAAADPQGKVAWSAQNVATLSTELAALRAGITFTGPGLVCARGTLCTTDVRDPALPLLLAKDSFDVVVTLTVPELTHDGDWQGKFQEFCSPWIVGVRESLDHPSHIEWPVTVPSARAQPVTLVAHTIDPSPYPVAQRCAWRLQFTRRDGKTVELTGRYELESPYPQPSHSLAPPAEAPQPEAAPSAETQPEAPPPPEPPPGATAPTDE